MASIIKRIRPFSLFILLIILLSCQNNSNSISISGRLPLWYSSNSWNEAINFFVNENVENKDINFSIEEGKNTYYKNENLESLFKDTYFSFKDIERIDIAVVNSAVFKVSLLGKIKVGEETLLTEVEISYTLGGEENNITTINGNGYLFDTKGKELASYIILGNGNTF